MMSIGCFADAAGLTVEALRHDDETGCSHRQASIPRPDTREPG